MNTDNVVVRELQALRARKGLPDMAMHSNQILLGDDLGIDSLDLATLVVALEERTGLHPFEAGFVMFRTVGELVTLFDSPTQP